MVNVIWHDADGKKLLTEFFHDMGTIVNLSQEDSLVHYGKSAVRQHGAGLFRFRGNLSGMVEMCGNIDGLIFFEHFNQAGCDPHGKNHRRPRADADNLNMGDGTQFLEDLFEFCIGHNQRVAAGNYNIPDFGMFSDVV